MNKNKIFWMALLACIALAGCTAPKNAEVSAVSADGTIDACKVKKPPENQDVLRTGEDFTYPNILNLADDYTGCVKSWVGDNYKRPPPYNYFILSAKEFKNGRVIKTENYEIDFSGRKYKVERACHFGDDGKLISNLSSKDCPALTDITIQKEKVFYSEQVKSYEEIEK